jgi:hypothetical protein
MRLLPAVSTVTVMHEEVHQRAREKKEEGQRAEQVGGVFGYKVKAGDGQKTQQDDAATGAP